MVGMDMSPQKEIATEVPRIIVQPAEVRPKMSSTKKYIILGVFGFLFIGLILVGILVGMHMFTEAQKELVNFTLKLEGDRFQEVTSDKGLNIVKYHVKDTDHEAWVVNDFNTDIKVTKITTKSETTCFITPLNRSTAMEPSMVTKPSTDKVVTPDQHDSVVYKISGEAVSDISFLNKEARTMCQSISTYWMYPTCGDGAFGAPDNKSMSVHKRDAPYWVASSVYYNGYYYPCINGCCKTICACQIYYSWTLVGGIMRCNWYYYSCCPGTSRCYYANYCKATPGLVCYNGYC